MPQMRDLKTEVFKVVCLDSNNRIIDISDAAWVQSITLCRLYGKSFIRLCRNSRHLSFVSTITPAANITPSAQDKKFTKELSAAGKLMGIKVLDHVIIGDDQFYSFADEGLHGLNMPNQTPEQIARDNIDRQLSDCGWIIQNKKQINLTAGLGVAVTRISDGHRPCGLCLVCSTGNLLVSLKRKRKRKVFD